MLALSDKPCLEEKGEVECLLHGNNSSESIADKSSTFKQELLKTTEKHALLYKYDVVAWGNLNL